MEKSFCQENRKQPNERSTGKKEKKPAPFCTSLAAQELAVRGHIVSTPQGTESGDGDK